MGGAAEGAGVVSGTQQVTDVSACMYGLALAHEVERAVREYEDALRAERQAERETQALHEHVSRLYVQAHREQDITTGGGVISVIVVAIALLFAALPAHAEPATLTAARTAQVTCVQREYRTRTASAGVSATEAALVARAQAEHVCALEAWSRALGSAAEVRVVTATRAPVVCEAAPLEWSFVDRVLVPAGSCALGCGLVASGAAAAAVWGCSR